MVRWTTGAVAAVALGFAAPAAAQDADWSGFYIGVNATGSRDKVSAEADLQVNQISNLVVTGRGIVVVPATGRDLDASGNDTSAFGGAQVGYQWQAGTIVFGAEAEFDPFERSAAVSQAYALPATILAPASTADAMRDVSIGNQWSVRARLGAALGRTLVYATGGYASARARLTSIDSYTNPGGPTPPGSGGPGNPTFNSGPEGPVVTTASARRNMGGWTGGIGVEQALGRRFSAALEYRHTDLGAKDFSPTNTATVNTGPETRGDNGATGILGNVQSGPTRIQLQSDAVSLRLNFRF